MEWLSATTGVRCRACGQEGGDIAGVCPECGGIREVTFDPDRVADGRDDIAILEARRTGGTPMCESGWLRAELDVEAVYVKDEGRNPTGHISDRDMAAVVARSSGTLSLPSAGRTGVAAAAAAAAADLEARVFVPARAPFATKALINVHGGDMRVVPGRYPDAHSAFTAEMAETDFVDARPVVHPFARAGRMTAYLEILRDLDWSCPDVLVVPAGLGASALAFASAASLAVEAGVVDRAPRFVLGQPAGCSPLVESLEDGTDPVPWPNPDTICGELEIPASPAAGEVVEAVRSYDPEGIAVPDAAALEAAVRAADEDGLALSVAGGVAAAAATDLADLESGDSVVVLNPGAAPVDADVLRSHLMSQGI